MSLSLFSTAQRRIASALKLDLVACSHYDGSLVKTFSPIPKTFNSISCSLKILKLKSHLSTQKGKQQQIQPMHINIISFIKLLAHENFIWHIMQRLSKALCNACATLHVMLNKTSQKCNTTTIVIGMLTQKIEQKDSKIHRVQ